MTWIPEPTPKAGHYDQKPFVLSHPDMDIQNFLVSSSGALQAIIDWDGVHSAPAAWRTDVIPVFTPETGTRLCRGGMKRWKGELSRPGSGKIRLRR